MEVSDRGLQFICNFESFRPRPYRDGGGVWTVGYGEKLEDNEVAAFQSGVTEQEARNWMRGYLQTPARRLMQTFPWAAQWQLDAMASLAENIGYDEFQKSTICHKLMTKEVDLSPWLWFVKDEHEQEEPGLVKRRVAELRLFLFADYGTVA